jgi:hypothetical protein
MMRKIILTTLLCAAMALPARAESIKGGKVTGINDAARSFDCHWKTKDWTFSTTESTVIRAGKKHGTWSDMKAGRSIQVEFHQSGNERVADRIIITGLSF